MYRSRSIVILGALIALLPLLGFPSAWEAFFQVVAGLSIVGISVWSQIDKKLSQKAKAQMRARKASDAFRETERDGASQGRASFQQETMSDRKADEPAFGKRITDFYPKTGQPGRRASDLKPPTIAAVSDNVTSSEGENLI